MKALTTALALVALLATTALAQPANDDCANATVIGSLPFTDTVDTSTATNDNDVSAGLSTCANFDHSVWYEVTAGASDVTLVVDAWEGSAYVNTLLYAYGGPCGALGAPLGGGTIRVQEGENLAVNVPSGSTVKICLGGGFTGGLARVHAFEPPEFLVDDEGYDAEFSPNAAAANANGDFLLVWSGFDDVLDTPQLRSRVHALDGTPVGAQTVLDQSDAFWLDAAARGPSGFVVVWDGSGGIQVQRLDDAGTPLGAPFTANQTSGYGAVGVASDAAGNFVVAWNGPTFRLFDASGTPLGNEHTVDSSAYWLDVGRDAAGNFVVVWEKNHEVIAQRFDATGSSVGGLVTVSSDYAYRPVVSAAPGGEFLVVWERDFSYVVARAYDAAGTPVGAAFDVSGSEQYTLGDHRPRVDSDAVGDFVVAWEDDDGRADYDFQIDVSARRIGKSGIPLGPKFAVNTINDRYQFWPGVGVAPGGEFMVVWGDDDAYPFAQYDSVVARGFGAGAFRECPAAPPSTCRATILPDKSKLLVRNDGTDPEDVAINWKLVKGESTAAADFGDPLASDDLFFCLYNETSGSAGGALVTQAALPAAGLCAGKPCWKGLGKPPGAKGFKYKDTERTPNGVLKAVLKGGDDGKAKVVFKAGRGNLATGPAGGPPTIPIVGSLTTQLHAPSTGTCWSATFNAATAKRNSGGIFQASGD